MRRSFILLSALFCLGISACNNSPKPTGPALVYVLRASYPDLLIRLSDHNTDSLFRRAVAMAGQEGSGRDYISSFASAYATLAPTGRLASIFAYVPRYQKQLTQQATNEEVIAVLQQSFAQSLDESAAILAKRFEVKVPPITWSDVLKRNIPKVQVPYTGEVKTRVLKDQGLIEVSVTGAERPARIRNMVLAQGDIGIWETYENEEIFPALSEADKTLLKMQGKPVQPSSKEKKESAKAFFKDAVVLDKSDTQSAPPVEEETVINRTVNPLFSILGPCVNSDGQLLPGPAIGMSLGKDTAMVNLYLTMTRHILPHDLKLMWSQKPLGDNDVYQLYAIRRQPGHNGPSISGAMLTDAKQDIDATGQPMVYLTMNNNAAARWDAMTNAAANSVINGVERHRCLAISVDDKVLSAPRVLHRITGSHTQISGVGSVEEAIDLADILRNGTLPAPLVLVEERMDPAPAK